jgi:hypothetical protein
MGYIKVHRGLYVSLRLPVACLILSNAKTPQQIGMPSPTSPQPQSTYDTALQ